MDTVSRATRSRMMAGIRGTDTKPEMLVRKALFSAGFRYRKNCAGLPGTPDLKLTQYKAVIFVHGCFWHGHDCRYFRIPKSNSSFWADKIRHNKERDARDILALFNSGWRVCVVWECATRVSANKNIWPSVTGALSTWIKGTEPFMEIFDPESMHTEPKNEESPKLAPGINSDIEAFVAERAPPYS
jgi:DNA mismatch endonuclease (patch repair protein)